MASARQESRQHGSEKGRVSKMMMQWTNEVEPHSNNTILRLPHFLKGSEYALAE